MTSHVAPPTVEDLFLAVDLERRGCKLLADQIRSAQSHIDVSCLAMALRQLLERASANPEALDELVRVVSAADEAYLEEDLRREARQHEAARRGGAEARAAGLIAADDIALMKRFHAAGGDDVAEALEECSTQEDVDKLKAFILAVTQNHREKGQ